MEDGDALVTFLKGDGGAFGAIRLEGPLRDGRRELELYAGLAGWVGREGGMRGEGGIGGEGGVGGEGGDKGGLSLVFGAEGELLLQGADLLFYWARLFVR